MAHSTAKCYFYSREVFTCKSYSDFSFSSSSYNYTKYIYISSSSPFFILQNFWGKKVDPVFVTMTSTNVRTHLAPKKALVLGVKSQPRKKKHHAKAACLSLWPTISVAWPTISQPFQHSNLTSWRQSCKVTTTIFSLLELGTSSELTLLELGTTIFLKKRDRQKMYVYIYNTKSKVGHKNQLSMQVQCLSKKIYISAGQWSLAKCHSMYWVVRYVPVD